MFDQLITSGLKDNIPDFYEILNDECGRERDHDTRRRLCLTLLELAEELITGHETVTIYSYSESFNHFALSALPYKAAFCARMAHNLSYDDYEIKEKAEAYFMHALDSINHIKTHKGCYAHPYQFSEIQQTPILLQVILT